MSGWRAKPLSDVCLVFADGDWIESKDQSSSGIRLIQTGNVGEGNFKDREAKARYISEATFKRLRCTEIVAGDCLISRLPDPVGRSCILPDTGERMITAVDCTIVRFDTKQMIPEFFNYFTQSLNYLSSLDAETSGTTRKRISRSKLGQAKIPVPPLAEQRQIVGILDESFAGIATAKANAEKNLQNARALFESRLQSVFTQHGKGWAEKTLGDVCETTQGVQIPKNLHHQSPAENRRRYLYISDFKHDGNLKYVDDIYPKKRVTEDDLIVVNTGATAGNIFRGIDGVLSNNLFKVTLNPGIDADFLYYFVTSSLFKEHQKTIVKGTANPHMGHENFKSTPANIPPHDVQLETVAKLDGLSAEAQRLAGVYERKLAALEALKKSLLHQTFSGQLAE